MTATSTTTKAKAPVRFALPALAREGETGGVPPLVRAAALALAVARHCKTGSWKECAERIKDLDHPQHDEVLVHLSTLDVDPEDSALIVEHDHVLRLLNVRPLITLAVCPECNGWVLVNGTAPTRCKVLRDCPGKPVKASIATKEKPPKASDTDTDADNGSDSDPDTAPDSEVTSEDADGAEDPGSAEGSATSPTAA